MFNTMYIKKYGYALTIAALLIGDIAVAALFGLTHSIDVSTFHMDGAYQTSSGLYRLADGYWPGQDFFPYLGVGLLFSFYPLFLLMGSTITASVFTAYFMVACATSFGVGLTAFLTIRRRSGLSAVLIGSIFLCAMVLRFDHLLPWLAERFTPGNSLRPFRAFIPYACAPLLFLLMQSRLKPLAIAAAVGVMAAFAFTWTNDFGIPTAGLIGLIALVWAYHVRKLSLSFVAVLGGTSLVASLVIMTILTHGHFVELLGFNFLDVAHDQYWYYGPWTADSRILSLHDFVPKIYEDTGRWVFVLIALCILCWKRPRVENFLLLFIGADLLAGGVLATVGGHRGYMAAFVFWARVTLYTSIFACLLNVIIFIAARYKVQKPFVVPMITGLALGFVLVAADRSYMAYSAATTAAAIDPTRFYVPELKGYLPADWHDHVELARATHDQAVVEEYWGIWSATLHKHPPQSIKVDSADHALGRQRALYGDAMRQFPDVVITGTRVVSTAWEPFLFSAHWEFYEPLLQNYTPLKTSPTTLVWRRSAPVIWPDVGCEVSNGIHPFFKLADKTPGFYDITLDYANEGLSSRALVLAQNNLNYVAGADGHVSMDPSADRASFPAVITDDGDNSFEIKLIAASGDLSAFKLKGCRAKKIMFSNEDLLPASDLHGADMAFNVTDKAWVGGFSRVHGLFFVTATKASKQLLQPGRKVRFADGTVRAILRQEAMGENIGIVYDGEMLDATQVGYPHKFEVLK